MAKDAAISAEEARQLLDYDPDTGIFTWLRRDVSEFASVGAARSWNRKYAGKVAGTPSLRTGYWRITIKNRPVLAHRLAMTLALGKVPDGEVDHINGDRRDNRISNLRVVTTTENRRNIAIPKSNTSGIIGVGFRRGTWRATIAAGDGRHVELGTFATKEEAAAARLGAERALGFHPNHGRRAIRHSSVTD